DLVVVDGRARMGCLAAGAAKVAPGGWLVLDNANYPRYRERLAELRATVLRGWREVDLSGPGPYSRTPAWQTLAWQCPAAPAAPKPAGVSALRQALARLPVRPYDRISYRLARMGAAEVARAIAGEPFEILGLQFDCAPKTMWKSKDGDPRSRSLSVNSWLPLEPLLDHASEFNVPALTAFLCERVGEWIDQFGSTPLRGAGTNEPETEESFIGYDTSIGNRFFRLAWLVAAAASGPAIGDALFAKLVDALVAHRKALMRDENFSAHTNHGLFQAMAQVCGASRFLSRSGRSGVAMLGMRAAYEQGKARLLATLAAQLAADGVHREHSPMYHVILANSLDWVADQGIVTEKAFGEAVGRMRAAAAWMFDTQGRIANLGDSDLEADPPYPVADAAAPAAPEQATFAAGGYWFVKGPEVYLAQAAAFHSRVHKQADTGAFLWRDRGVDILVEPGRFGYVGRTAPGEPAFRDGFWYGDARRRYVESTRAHNTLSVDGRNHPRFRSPPFGSSIEAVADANGVFACESSVRNLPRLTHSRLVLLKPSEWLLCVDLLRARDAAAHLATQHFHFHPDWHLKRRRRDGALLRHPGGLDLHLNCVFEDASISETARGRGASRGSDPDVLGGWWSPRHMAFEPCQAISVTAEGEHLALATLFTFADVEIDRTFTGFNATRRRLRFRWTGAGGAESITVDRDTDKDGQRRLRLS
ncbi:MAG TPA: heparinase II/III family protein, partial [Hyphomicrobiales bacterium]|nr:heparinase II/III family protein [Hyphomicrobiales bacterium]